MEGDGVRGVVRIGHDVGVFISRGVEIQNVAVCKDVIDPRDLIERAELHADRLCVPPRADDAIFGDPIVQIIDAVP